MEVELFACYVPVHVDRDDGFVLPLGSWLDEEEIAVEDEGCHGIASGAEEESPPANTRACVHAHSPTMSSGPT